jgi:hypothetical protein
MKTKRITVKELRSLVIKHQALLLETDDYSVDQLHEAVFAEVDGIATDLVHAAIAWEVDKVDRSIIRDEDTQQGVLFPLSGAYPIGEKRRVPKKNATIEHMIAYIAIHDKNLAANQGCNARLHEEFELLRRFWTGKKSAAVEAYNAAADLP